MKGKLVSVLLTLAVAVSLMVMPAVTSANPSSVQFVTTGNATAEWSTDTSHSGYYSVLLTAASPDSASVGIPVNTPLANITGLSFWYNHSVCTPAAGHVVGPDLVLILVNTTSQYYLAGRGGADCSVGTWQEADAINGTKFAESSVWWYGSFDGANLTTYQHVGAGNFSVLKADGNLTDAMVLYVGVNLDPPGDGGSGSVYVDDITVNGVSYNLEPSATVGLSAKIEEITAISVNPPSIDYDTISPGYDYTHTLTVSNVGSVPVSVTTEITGDTLFTTCLTLEPATINPLVHGSPASVGAHLKVPLSYHAQGLETGTIIFEATAL